MGTWKMHEIFLSHGIDGKILTINMSIIGPCLRIYDLQSFSWNSMTKIAWHNIFFAQMKLFTIISQFKLLYYLMFVVNT